MTDGTQINDNQHGTEVLDNLGEYMESLPRRVWVYFNLHKKQWSVKALTGDKKGRVIAHLDSIKLTDIHYRVQPAGLRKVRDTGVKNVHAGVVGWWDGDECGVGVPQMYRRISYNPFVRDVFYDVESLLEAEPSPVAILSRGKVWVPANLKEGE
jgi:hypothetical protein